MAGKLTIRNLTSCSIELKLVESYGDLLPSTEGKNTSYAPSLMNGFVSTFTSPFKISASPSSNKLEAKTETHNREETSILIEAFTRVRTDIISPDPASTKILRLTFQCDSQRYRIDLPTSLTRSSTLIPLTPKPKYEFTAIHLPDSSHLTLFSSANLSSWMGELRNETPLSLLSIPGTHNSPAHYYALPSVRCQAVAPKEQLENGVRFFDIRVQPEYPADPSKDGLILVHSAFPISLTGTKYFRDLVNVVLRFLDQNPSETVVFSMKREGIGSSTDAQLSRILRDNYVDDGSRWYTAPHIPTLGEARNKVILMRRFELEDTLRKEWNGQGWCLDAETWEDNTSHAVSPSGDFCVQDFYEVLETQFIQRKIQYAQEQLERSASSVPTSKGPFQGSARQPHRPIYLNFLSASNFWRTGCWPENVAAKLNPAIVDHLCRIHNTANDGKRSGDGGTGIVVCDWVGNNGDWDLVRCIIGMNAKLKLQQSQT